METKYKIGDDVYYKRLLEITGNSIGEYIVRRGTVSTIRIETSGKISYGVTTLNGEGVVSFVLPENEIYSTQEEILKSIK